MTKHATKDPILVPDLEPELARRGAGMGRAWSVLGWAGFALGVIGAVDVFLTWYPFAFGNPEWEFGTVSQSFNGLPTVTLGFGLWLASAIVSGRRWLGTAIAVGFIVLTLLVLGAAILYATTVPMALDSVPQNAISTGLKKSIAKTAAQALLYPIVFGVIGVKGLKAARIASR